MNICEEPIDFDRLMLKTNVASKGQNSQGQSPTDKESPLDLIRSLTAQFKTHFQEIKDDLTQKVELSAREIQKFEITKKELKQEDQNIGYQGVPSIPIQNYDWRHQKLAYSPQRTGKQIKTKSTRLPPKQQLSQDVPIAVKKNITYKQPKQMDKYAYSKRYQRYLDQKYYQNVPIIVKTEIESRIRDMKQDGNILNYDLTEEQENKIRQCQSVMMDKQSSAFTSGNNNKLLKFVKKYEYDYRKQAFKKMMEISGNITDKAVTKNSVVRYLFDNVVMMMLYSIDPYQLVEEIACFVGQTPNQLNFVELSNFLLTPRQPPTSKIYSEENLLQAELSSFRQGTIVEPVIPYVTWLDADETVQQIFNCYQYVDIFGKRRVQTQDLIIRLNKYSQSKNILAKQIMFITQIGKPISLQRLIYQIQYQHPRRKEWTFDSFKQFFYDYRKLATLPRQQVIQNKMIEGILDWTLLVNTSVLAVLRQTYNNCSKYCDSYVDKVEYLDLLYSNTNFDKIKGFEVRRAPFMDVGLETVEQTLARIYYEADEYLEIDEIIDFFTNRGRPYLTQQKIKARNSQLQLLKIQYQQMQRQNQDTKDSEDEDIQYSILRQQKKKQQYKVREAKTNQIKQKMKNITIPVPFEFKQSNKDTIRQRKLKQMLMEKQLKIQEELKPIVVAKEVPWYVKQNLYQRFQMEQESLRRRRLQAFKTHLQTQMNPPPDRLLQLPQRGEGNNAPVTQYEFVARPFPWYCEIELLDRINRQKLDRRDRIRKQIQERQFQDGTPQGIKNMMQRQKILKQKWNLKNKDKRVQSQEKIKPFKVKKVPDFKRIFEENGIQLEVRDLRPKQQHHIETWQQHKKKRVSFKQQVQAPPPAKSTLKTDALAELRRKQRLQELVKKQKQEQQDNDRFLRQQKLAPKVKSVLKRMKQQHDAELQKFQKQKDNDRKKKQQQRKKWYQQTLYQAYKKVVEQRPLLIESMNPPKIPSSEMIEQIQKSSLNNGKPKTQNKKLRQNPIKKVLRRTDDRVKNLEQRAPQKQQDYDDDNYEDQFQEQQSQSYEQYQKHSPQRDYLQKQRAEYQKQLLKQQFQDRMINQQDQQEYLYHDQDNDQNIEDEDDEQYYDDHSAKNHSF